MKARTPLSPRQCEIISQVARGRTDKEVSSLLKISEGTIKNHFTKIFKRLRARSRAHAVFLFYR